MTEYYSFVFATLLMQAMGQSTEPRCLGGICGLAIATHVVLHAEMPPYLQHVPTIAAQDVVFVCRRTQ